ncbi:MAG: hypothetical protein LBL49_07260 [Clostridiales Family XIII bacterium]|nr:hypothetical protein [Clostridiales Family XIII bacterium]
MLIVGMGVGSVHAFVHTPFSKTPAVLRLPIVIVSLIVMLALTWWFRDMLMHEKINNYFMALAVCLVHYTYIGQNGFFKPIWGKGKTNLYTLRALFAALSALSVVVIYILDPFSMARVFMQSGDSILLIVIMSLYSFALTMFFSRLELKLVPAVGSTDSYRAWLSIPAVMISTVLVFIWIIADGQV